MVATWHLIESSPVAESYARGTENLDEVRKKIGAFLNCDKEDLVLTGCTSDAMNRLSFALSLQPGDHILSTDQEHEGGHDCWKFHARTRGVEVEDIPIGLDERDPQAIVDRFAQAIKPKTRALSFSHVLYTNGVRLPAAELCELARRKGVVSIIDGAQAVGNIAVDIEKIGCDAYAAPGHKWLLGPKGTGFMFVSRAAAPRLELLTRLTDTKVQNDTTGLANHMGFQGLAAAIDYVNRVGMTAIERHNRELHAYAYDRIKSLPVGILSPKDASIATPLLSFKVDEKFEIPKLIPALLAQENLVIKGLPKLGGLRLSFHLFNSEADIDRAVAILKRRLT
jgi:selenocysteine lyase/cysteine desulfurase